MGNDADFIADGSIIHDGSIRIQVKGRLKLWLVRRWVKHPKIVFEPTKPKEK